MIPNIIHICRWQNLDFPIACEERSPMCGIQTHDVVDTDCTGSCKSNYETITIEHDAPHKQLENLNFATYIYVLY
jgi:hypothetical protein